MQAVGEVDLLIFLVSDYFLCYYR